MQTFPKLTATVIVVHAGVCLSAICLFSKKSRFTYTSIKCTFRHTFSLPWQILFFRLQRHIFKGALSRAALGTRFCLFGGEIYVLSSFFIVLDLVNPWPSDLETSTDAFLFTWAS